MQGKIALEEHFAIPETLSDSAGFLPDSVWGELSGRLLDIHEKRLRLMDEHGIERVRPSRRTLVIHGCKLAQSTPVAPVVKGRLRAAR